MKKKIIIPSEEPKHPKVFSENGSELLFDKEGNLTKEEPKQLFTDYPITELGDNEFKEVPIRQCELLSYDDNKYCYVKVEGIEKEIKRCYIYPQKGRCGEVDCVSIEEIKELLREEPKRLTTEELTEKIFCNNKETLGLKRSYQKHSLTKTKGYKLWCNIIQRCYNSKNHSYKYYGEKGVVMEDYFKDSYKNFINWLEGLLDYNNWLNSSELSLDRINNNLGYVRGNLKFSTKTEQVENQNLRLDNKSGYKGVCYYKLNKKYGATITIDKSKVFLGYYDTALEAALVYDNYVLKNNLNRKTNL